MRYTRRRSSGFTFVFKYDDQDPSLLHIFARHLTSPADAIQVFLDPTAVEHHNAERRRFERYGATHGLFWFWLNEDERVVMVITCFTLDGGG